MTWIIHRADVTDWLRAYDGPRFHAVFCDPPYGLAFMYDGASGRNTWDKFDSSRTYQDWVSEWAALLIERALYPGAVGLFFGGTRTWHRLACGLEDARFEVVDTLMWLYGSGFPKSTAVGKSIDKAAGARREIVGQSNNGRPNRVGKHSIALAQAQTKGGDITLPATPDAARFEGYGTHLKPAWESVLLVRAPRGGRTFAQLAVEYGTGALAIDGSRISIGEKRPARTRIGSAFGWNGGNGKASGTTVVGRYPANLILDESAAALLDAQSGENKSSAHTRHNGGYKSVAKGQDYPHNSYGIEDSGGASRYFYCAKASRSEREAGLETRNFHPTVKPLALCAYLARLICPPPLDEPRRLLVPFAGVASEMIGAARAGWDDITGIEISDEYADIGEARLRHWLAQSTQQELFT